jgi:hypothetical protein
LEWTPQATKAPAAPLFPSQGNKSSSQGDKKLVPMTTIRKRIAERLVEAKNTTAMLTTFNEVNMTEIFKLRERYKERFQEIHDVSLGIMSFFVRASILALQEFQVGTCFAAGISGATFNNPPPWGASGTVTVQCIASYFGNADRTVLVWLNNATATPSHWFTLDGGTTWGQIK